METMRLEIEEDDGRYMIKELPFTYEYRLHNSQSIYPITRDGFCIYGAELSLDEEDLLELEKMGEYGKSIADEASTTMGWCCDICNETWVTKKLTIADLTILCQRGIPRWLYKKIVRHNRLYSLLSNNC